jgi:CheY-like chemotaxis protein
LRSARPVLETLGYSVIAAGSAEDALRLAAERALEIRLLLTDVVHGGRPTRAPATPPRVKERP